MSMSSCPFTMPPSFNSLTPFGTLSPDAITLVCKLTTPMLLKTKLLVSVRKLKETCDFGTLIILPVFANKKLQFALSKLISSNATSLPPLTTKRTKFLLKPSLISCLIFTPPQSPDTPNGLPDIMTTIPFSIPFHFMPRWKKPIFVAPRNVFPSLLKLVASPVPNVAISNTVYVNAPPSKLNKKVLSSVAGRNAFPSLLKSPTPVLYVTEIPADVTVFPTGVATFDACALLPANMMALLAKPAKPSAIANVIVNLGPDLSTAVPNNVNETLQKDPALTVTVATSAVVSAEPSMNLDPSELKCSKRLPPTTTATKRNDLIKRKQIT